MQGHKKIRRYLRRHHRTKLYLSSTEAARGSFCVFYANIQTICRVLGLPVGLVYKLLRAYGVYFSPEYIGRVRSAIGTGICKPLAPSLTYLQVFADVLRLPLWGLLLPPELFSGWFAGVVGSGRWELMAGAAVVRWVNGTGGKGSLPVLEVIRGGYFVAGIPGAVSGADHVPVLLRRGPRGGLPRFRCVGGSCVGRFVNSETGEAVYLFESDSEASARAAGRELLAGVPVPIYPVEFERFESVPATARAAYEGWRKCMYVSDEDLKRVKAGEITELEAVRMVGRLEIPSWEEIEEAEEEGTDFISAYSIRLKAEQLGVKGENIEAYNKKKIEEKQRDKARGFKPGESRKKGRGLDHEISAEGPAVEPEKVEEGNTSESPVISESEDASNIDWGALGLGFMDEK